MTALTQREWYHTIWEMWQANLVLSCSKCVMYQNGCDVTQNDWSDVRHKIWAMSHTSGVMSNTMRVMPHSIGVMSYIILGVTPHILMVWYHMTRLMSFTIDEMWHARRMLLHTHKGCDVTHSQVCHITHNIGCDITWRQWEWCHKLHVTDLTESSGSDVTLLTWCHS